MAFRNKLEPILTENPDILVIPESENPEKFNLKSGLKSPVDSFWYGDNPNKGIGIYTYNGWKINPIKEHNRKFRYIIPLIMINNKFKFILLAIWCQKPEKGDNYGIYTWNAINHYKKLLKNDRLILAGDFNSNSIWDKPNREANHTNIVNRLEEQGIKSTYHFYNNEEQGKEKHPTLYLHRKVDKGYHIDYCFATDFFIKKLEKVKIGEYQNWTDYSDHTPLIIHFNI